MGKVHKSLRIEQELAVRVTALQAEGESEAATYSRVIEAGVARLEEPAGRDAGGGGEVVEYLREHIVTMKDEIETLKAQLNIKDEQLHAMTVIVEQAQTLHAMTGTKALQEPAAAPEPDVVPQEREEPRGLFRRFRRSRR